MIVGSDCGSDPLSVVDSAIGLKNKKHHGEDFQKVWCVVDTDSHTTLSEALNKAKANHIDMAISCPCFEIWLLLHFSASTRPHADFKQVVKELRRYLPNNVYEKTKPPLDDLYDRIDDALKNAASLRRHLSRSGATNPRTDVDEVVRHLKSLL